ncbi:similar to ribonuclease H [Plenodomus lingam JN3]|uniref:ribonuclease H n=1 Tax=Leptosphaeria maculans (strain JN3 / isolate v23.1.3 / race Av1-4-5-6-7-8) TaxID=985895 RepID=E5A202_LEPMJ|nr:similar to ribonuclease H [Plenodomus lingam JN3]CBX97719.1 similar to ribonuclease H [Plenodomus lingam JN3]
MVFQVDGARRSNGYDNADGAAACVLLRRNRQPYLLWGRRLPNYPKPTNQRAELTAIVLALRNALLRDEELGIQTTLDITIESDSKYAIGYMTTWIHKWVQNGWINASGREVANQDLLEEAVDLEQRILDQNGEVEYKWIPRSQNVEADRYCNEVFETTSRSIL